MRISSDLYCFKTFSVYHLQLAGLFDFTLETGAWGRFFGDNSHTMTGYRAPPKSSDDLSKIGTHCGKEESHIKDVGV